MVQAMHAKVGSGATKLVLLKLADNANDDGQCFPSYKNIAEHCEMNRRTVMRHIEKLKQMGFIEITYRRDKDKNMNRSNVYTLTIENGDVSKQDTADQGSDKLTPPKKQGGGDTESLGGDRGSLGGSDTESPRISHSFETVKEPKEKYKKEKSLDYSKWPQLPDPVIFDDWIAQRKRLKADVSQTVVNTFAKQLQIAVDGGLTVDECLSQCVTRKWQGFKAEWLLKDLNRGRYSAVTLRSIENLRNI